MIIIVKIKSKYNGDLYKIVNYIKELFDQKVRMNITVQRFYDNFFTVILDSLSDNDSRH